MTEKGKSYLRDLAKKYREVSESDANQKKREKWFIKTGWETPPNRFL